MVREDSQAVAAGQAHVTDRRGYMGLTRAVETDLNEEKGCHGLLRAKVGACNCCLHSLRSITGCDLFHWFRTVRLDLCGLLWIVENRIADVNSGEDRLQAAVPVRGLSCKCGAKRP